MGRGDARNAQIGGPDGISQFFHVSTYSGEPYAPIRTCNLFAKYNCRLSLGDEPSKSGPKVAFVVFRFALSGNAEGLAGATAGPDGLIIGPAGETEGVGPASDSSEKVALAEFFEFAWLDIYDAPFIDHTRSDVASLDEFPQPFCGFAIVFIVVVHFASVVESTMA